MQVRTRFAPSPTGALHVGNLRIALFCKLLSIKNKGIFILRLDDTDQSRCISELEEGIKMDLTRMNLAWDIIFKQSERTLRYQEISEQMKKDGLLYPCYENKDELEDKRKIRLAIGLPPIYDRSSLKITKKELKVFEQEGRKPHWRFRVEEDKIISWQDEIKGNISFNSNLIGDPVVIRENGTYTYMLISVIDDIDYQITHVIRGEDHLSNSAIQVQMFEKLYAELPIMAHCPLLKSEQNNKLSKRNENENFTINGLLEKNEPIAVLNYLADIGFNENPGEILSLDEIAKNFSLENYSRNYSARFFEGKLAEYNKNVLRSLTHEAINSRLKKSSNVSLSADMWEVIRDNVSSLEEIKIWQSILSDEFENNLKNGHLDDEEKNIIKTAIKEIIAPSSKEPLFYDGSWLAYLSKKMNNKKLYKLIRKSLLGREDGPSLKKIVTFLGNSESARRMQKFLKDNAIE